MLEINSKKKFYFKDELITITISLNTKLSLFINSFKFYLIENKKLFIYENNNKIYDIENKNIQIEYSIINNKEINSGFYIYTVKFYIKTQFSTTIYNKNINNLKCYIKNIYLVKIILNNLENNLELNIVNNIESDYLDLRILLRKYFIFKKSYFYRIILDKKLYFTGDFINIKLVNKREQKIVIKNINIKLYELIKIYKNNKIYLRSSLINNLDGVLKCKIKIPEIVSSSCYNKEYEIEHFLLIKLELKNGDFLEVKKKIIIYKLLYKIEEIMDYSIFDKIIIPEIYLD